MKIVPVSAFSGLPPSAGGLKLGSRQLPVQVGGRGVEDSGHIGFFVTNQRAVRRCAWVSTRFPPRLPENFITAKKGQVHSGGPRRLDVGTLDAAPVLVMTDREENLVIDQLGAFSGGIQAIGVDPGHVTNIVTVGLQPADGAILPRQK